MTVRNLSLKRRRNLVKKYSWESWSGVHSKRRISFVGF